MKTTLIWKKGLFNKTYRIYSNNSPIGKLVERTWSSSADGEINNKKYQFKTQRFFKQKTQIIDTENNSVIGTIVYNIFMTRATIEYLGQKAYWKYSNIWNTQFSITDLGGNKISYRGTSFNGKLEFNQPNDLLVLTGLFVTNYYWQLSVATLIIIFIPIWATLL
jgi:hypothetical protein